MTNEPTPNESEDAASDVPPVDSDKTSEYDLNVDVESPTEVDDADSGDIDIDVDAVDHGPDVADPDVDVADPDVDVADPDVADGYVPPQPPPVMAVTPVRRLVRDPYSRLGGVASGISHHYGIDVSLVRLGFILGTLFSGIGLILYFLAWLIVPRADYWPPVPAGADARTASPIEGRELAYGLLTVGILLAIFAGGGGAIRLVISVGLVGAGIWMLLQPPRQDTPPMAPGTAVPPIPVGQPVPSSPTAQVTPHPVAPASWQPAPAGAADAVTGTNDVLADDEFTSNYPGPPPPAAVATATYPTQAVYVPNPVPPRRRRVWPIVLILSLFILPILFALLVFGLIVGLGNGDFDARSVEIRPASVADLPDDINLGAGSVELDLTRLDAADFAELTTPYQLDIDINAGEVIVDVPDDIAVSVDASAGAGDVTVFENYREGIRPRIDTIEEDAVLELDIRVGVGEITVDR